MARSSTTFELLRDTKRLLEDVVQYHLPSAASNEEVPEESHTYNSSKLWIKSLEILDTIVGDEEWAQSPSKIGDNVAANLLQPESPHIHATNIIELDRHAIIPKLTVEDDPVDQIRVIHNRAGVIRGYQALQQYLEQLQSSGNPLPTLILKMKRRNNALSDIDELPTIMFSYAEEPVPGWTRLLYLRLSGKTKGKIDIHYLPPSSSHRFRSRGDLHSYIKHSLPTKEGEKFMERVSFSATFCVCQRPEHQHSHMHSSSPHIRSVQKHFVECSYGKCGCNGWIHPVCVGLGHCSEAEMRQLPRLICPFCSVYLEATGSLTQFIAQGYLPLRYISTGYRGEIVQWSRWSVEASNIPHRVYGHCRLSSSSSSRQQSQRLACTANSSSQYIIPGMHSLSLLLT